MLPHQIGVSAGNQSNRDHMHVQKYAVPSQGNMKMQAGWSEGFPPLFALTSVCQCLSAYAQHQNQDLGMCMRPDVKQWSG